MFENNSIKILDEVSTHIATLTEKLNNLDETITNWKEQFINM